MTWIIFKNCRTLVRKTALAFDRDQGRSRCAVYHSSSKENCDAYIKVDEALWASGLLPAGILERWFIATGERIAEVRVEDALHEIVAQAGGCATIVAAANAVIEPGSILATLEFQSA